MQGGGGSSAPQFNSQQTAKDQSAANIQTAAANAYIGAQNQYTPYGNLTYKEVGGHDVNGQHIPEFQVTQDLSPSQQRIFDQQQYLQNRALGTANDVLGNVNTALKTPLNFNGLQNISAPAGDQSAFRDQAYNALKSRATDDLNKQMEAQRVQLANQGVAYGSEAYNRAIQPFTRETTDISNQALINANNLAGQNINQQGQIMGQQQGLRQQQIQERMGERNQPLLDYQALLGMSGGVQQPQWGPTINAQVAPTDVIGPAMAQYQGQMNAYNQQQGQSNALMGSLFGLGGAVLGGVAGGPLGASIGSGIGGMFGKGLSGRQY